MRLAKKFRKITTFTLIGSSSVDLTVINVLHTVHSIATSVLLRLECSIDCISGSVGHDQNIFLFIF